MKLEKELKRNLGSGLWNKIFAFGLIATLSLPVYAQPNTNDIPLPPVSFSRVTDGEILNSIGLDPIGGAWCYDDEANAILITAPARERSKCELKLMYELEKQKVKYQFEIDKLKLRVDTLTNQHREINLIKDREIDRLTEAAIKRPNDYTAWWATGGFVTGVLTTLAVVLSL